MSYNNDDDNVDDLKHWTQCMRYLILRQYCLVTTYKLPCTTVDNGCPASTLVGC